MRGIWSIARVPGQIINPHANDHPAPIPALFCSFSELVYRRPGVSVEGHGGPSAYKVRAGAFRRARRKASR
jgi:hypothetical protein